MITSSRKMGSSVLFLRVFHDKGGKRCHVQGRRKTDDRIYFSSGGFVRRFMFETLEMTSVGAHRMEVVEYTCLELEAQNRWQFPNTQTFTCFLRSWTGKCANSKARRRGGHTCEALPHLLQLYSLGPNFSGWVNLIHIKFSRNSRDKLKPTAYLRKQAERVFSPDTTSPPFPLSSKLMSNIGSTVLVTLPHLSHLTSLWSWPAKVEWMMQLQETLVEPREVVWIWFSEEMKNSCASCWA